MYYILVLDKKKKGNEMVLEEHGIPTAGKSCDWLRNEHSDFKDEKSMIETFVY